ncbi:ARM repeat-containing protein [Coniophora puteana RWD-64-598 SS2]|uniref:ARM repeat-containing protein n=1 Tax=Coniophora puteana (strain RWD-64-598) TaxID=741705 RepID=A0A5M3MCE8_CONPW|nr:ARM repeat-containing protein [Coniophora puteana RWD-64-598 SS2]EIW76321.1 ARM repeat-containing protein [Coniophora puteana RWD-64-598 SS2]
MDSAVSKQLVDKIYEKRKAAALELEKQIRECHLQGDQRRINQIIEQLVDMFSNAVNPLHIRNGGLIGLAGTAIALGVDIAPFMDKFIEPVLACFTDPENRIRYFSAECLYNIAKVSKGEVLVFFNPIFDALSKLAADSEMSVKNGAELLDRLLKDIVAETASVYIPQYPETEKVRDRMSQEEQSVLVPYPGDPSADGYSYKQKRAFSLAHFIPLLQDRIYVLSPFTRSFLVSWITVLDSVPELELVSYLPEFLDGLFKYMSDPTADVRTATENILAGFLQEIREVSAIQQKIDEHHEPYEQRRRETEKDKLPDITMSHSERALFIPENATSGEVDGGNPFKEEPLVEKEIKRTGAWLPGQGVHIDYAAIVEILIEQLDVQHDEIQQSTALSWLAEFLDFTSEVMVPFTPRLIPAILPNLAHHAPMIQTAAIRTNKLLSSVVQNLPSPADASSRRATAEKITPSVSRDQASSPTQGTGPPSKQSANILQPPRETTSPETTTTDAQSQSTSSNASSDKTTAPLTQRSRVGTQSSLSEMPNGTPAASAGAPSPSRPQSRLSSASAPGGAANPPNAPTPVAQQRDAQSVPPPMPPPPPEEPDLFDYQATVTELTVQFLSEHEQTRVAALKWLIMLHQKAPKKILAMDDGTFPALLKTLSDSSEEVIKHDLQLLAQISSSSEEGYFKVFMMNLLGLFSTDRKLLEARGSLIIRQLCLNLNTERIYKTFAEILEKEEDLEFASDIVQKLNMILITSPELAEFRRRLKSLETRSDGQALFTTLYRSWCHNAVAVFSLCLLAQAYEHASNLLSIFADLEITVAMLVQIDKLVQLIESPIFTYLRLQLLEPERYPYLFKCLYGLLMLLPQSSAFVSLRNRLSAVNSAGFLHIAPKGAVGGQISSRSKVSGREEIKWQELLSHFRSVQLRHEKARRLALGSDASSAAFGGLLSSESNASGGGGRAEGAQRDRDGGGSRPGMRRKMSAGGEGAGQQGQGQGQQQQGGGGGGGRSVLSPLNPRARQTGLLASTLMRETGSVSGTGTVTGSGSGGSSSPPPQGSPLGGSLQAQQRQAQAQTRRGTLGLARK